MSSNWPTVKTEEIFDLINGFAFKSKEFCEHGAPVLKIKNVKAGYLSLDNLAYVDPIYLSKKSDKVAQKNDLLITMSGNRHDGSMETWVGKVSWFNENKLYLINQRVGILRLKEGLDINPRYMAYQLSSVEFQKHFIAVATSSGGQANLSPDQIKQTELSCPPRNIQDEIVNQIGSLEDKAKINSDTNQTLEQIAQALFKSWFVDFDPVKAKIEALAAGGSADDAELAAMRVISAKTLDELNSLKASNSEAINKLAETVSLFPEKLVESELGLIPEGWEVGDLSDLMDFNPKRTLKKGTVAPYLDMKNMPTAGHLALDIYDREMGSGTKFINGDALLARITPCLENGKTAYVDFLEDEQVGWGSTEYIVMRSKSDSYKYFSYFMARFEPFRKFAIQSMTGTSGRQRAQAKTVQTMPFVIPPLSILEKFDELIAANMKLIKRHGNENKTLAELRDTLLPKLLSGEIELSSEVVV